MEYASYLNRIAAAYEAFLEQNDDWIKLQKQWRVEDLERREQWEAKEEQRFKQRLQEDRKNLQEFKGQHEAVYREEAQKNLQARDLDELCRRFSQKKEGHE